jgi:TetR/AcrR family transcriptional regulator, transcriptional repressor for nem operon
MKVSKSKASDNRDAILQAASAQIRSRGLDQTSIADVARASGLTHGALYSHFASKDALATEAMNCAFADCLRDFAGLPAPQFLKRYLSTEHRDHPEVGCPAAALVSEISRQPAQLQEAFRGGVDRFVALAGESLEAVGAEHGHDRAVLLFAAMVGGLALSRALRDADAASSVDILRAVKKELGLLVDS